MGRHDAPTPQPDPTQDGYRPGQPPPSREPGKHEKPPGDEEQEPGQGEKK
jgi:hypothetical protein